MRIRNHKLEGFSYTPARLIGPVIMPEVVVIHDTASRLDAGSAANYLRTTDKASVHYVIEVDGAIVQQVPTNRRASHAGHSTFQGRHDVNAFSIGIELVNPGRMTRAGFGGAVSWWGKDFGYSEFKLVDMTTPEHGAGVWMPYPEAQIAALMGLLEALFNYVKTLRDITTHWYISPGRKIDTNPLFPLESIRARILGRDDPAQAAADAGGSEPRSASWVRIRVQGSLNIRRWPSFNPNVIGSVPDGTEVPVLLRGIFAGREWEKIIFNGQTGWVLGRYTTTV
jgi:N-acetylmuramoyl-L-alanine amidase